MSHVIDNSVVCRYFPDSQKWAFIYLSSLGEYQKVVDVHDKYGKDVLDARKYVEAMAPTIVYKHALQELEFSVHVAESKK